MHSQSIRLFVLLIFSLFSCSQYDEVKEYYDSGETKKIANFKNGLQEGKATHYYKNGKIEFEIFYVNGKIHGESKIYYRARLNF